MNRNFPDRNILCSAEDGCDQEKTAEFWRKNAQIALNDQVLKQLNRNVAKNVILFLGDGMSIPTVTAARIYQGQQNGNRGEESLLSFEKFPHVGLSKVRFVNSNDHQP